MASHSRQPHSETTLTRHPRRWTGVAALLCALAGGLTADVVRPAPGSVVLAMPEVGAKEIGVVRSPQPLESRARIVAFDNHHPLSRYYPFDLVTLPDGSEGWICPDLRAQETETGEIRAVAVRRPGTGVLVLFLLALAGVAAAALTLRPGATQTLSRRSGIATARLVPLLQSILLVTLCWARLLMLLCGASHAVPTPCDEHGYFEVARDLLNGSVAGPWRFTIGLPLLYVPFVWCLQAKSAFDLIVPFSYFNGFVVMPACALLLLVILRRLTGSGGKALTAACLWVLLPLLYHRFEYWDGRLFKSFLALPTASFCFQLYTEFIAIGFNAMSDVPATFLLLLALALALQPAPTDRTRALSGAALGAACLVRINCVFMAPAVAWMLWHTDRERLATWKTALRAVAVSVGAFVLVFAPQWVLNRMQFGSAWTFPYVLHATNAASGFEWLCVPAHLQYLVHSNYLYMVPGALALLWQRNRTLRIALTLWAVPMFAFFAGYTNTFCDATRFILIVFPALVAAVVSLDEWESPHDGSQRVLLGLLVVTLCLTCPTAYSFAGVTILGLGLETEHVLLALALLAAAGALLLLRRQPRRLAFAGAFLVLWYSAQQWAVAACLLAAGLRALWDWGLDLRSTFATYRRRT